MSYFEIQYINYLFIFYFLILAEGFHDEAFVSNIDVDYVWENPLLRARKLTCDEKLLQVICQTKCENNYYCIGGKCFCKSKSVKKKFLERIWYNIQKLLNERDTNQDTSNREADVSDALRTAVQAVRSDEVYYTERPTLRHHIAHFCPNIDEARKCIRRCMKLGKPAFCGKDHVCYCGHRYNSHDENKPIKLDDMYAEFRDLYEKYFGPQSGESMNIDNNCNDGPDDSDVQYVHDLRDKNDGDNDNDEDE